MRCAKCGLPYVVHKASGFDTRVRRDELLRIAFENGRFAVTGRGRRGTYRERCAG